MSWSNVDLYDHIFTFTRIINFIAIVHRYDVCW